MGVESVPVRGNCLYKGPVMEGRVFEDLRRRPMWGTQVGQQEAGQPPGGQTRQYRVGYRKDFSVYPDSNGNVLRDVSRRCHGRICVLRVLVWLQLGELGTTQQPEQKQENHKNESHPHG